MKKFWAMLFTALLILAGCARNVETQEPETKLTIERLSGPYTAAEEAQRCFALQDFAGNTSLLATLTLDDSHPNFCIYIENTGTNTILVSVEDESGQEQVFQCETGVYSISSTASWAAGSYSVGVVSGGMAGIYGSATAVLCAAPEKDS